MDKKVERKTETMIQNQDTVSCEKVKEHELWLNKAQVQRRPFYLFFKRFADIVFSILGLVVAFPILLIVAILMKKDEPKAPIFFSQIRVGKDGEEFRMYKVRSMVVDAEEKLKLLEDQNEIEGAMFKIKDDPRVTRVGKFIRKTSIDEFPQLFNVLVGDMSIVGPRPPLPREVAKYTDYDMQRLYVKPGCTGLWQVSGRNDLHFNEMVDLDNEYIAHQSLFYDLKIMIKTVFVIIFPNGSY